MNRHLPQPSEPLGSATLVNGAATFTTASQMRHTLTYTAGYAGDANHVGSTSNAETVHLT